MSKPEKEIIIIRSLTESDLGLFAAHRASARSKQRAININSDVAQILLSKEQFDKGGLDLRCICVFQKSSQQAVRRFGKTHKNWRFGGKKIEGREFADLDAKDFILLRSIANNDGSHPVSFTFISRQVDHLTHAGLVAMIRNRLNRSMLVLHEGETGFDKIAGHCPAMQWEREPSGNSVEGRNSFPEMPVDKIDRKRQTPSIWEKLRRPHILERMLKAAGDLSAPAQLRFLEIVDKLATQLRHILLETGGIVRFEKNHQRFWTTIKGQRVGFVDGGLANLSMLGSAPIAARVGGYTVIPGSKGSERESFTTLKHLIDELYSHTDSGVYVDSFPDIGALRDAARISVEAAGAVRLLSDYSDLKFLLLHGALVNPVSRYTDVMQDGKVRHRFPNFSKAALSELLPPEEASRQGRDCNFVSVHLRQLQLLDTASSVVCGVVERESTTTSVCRATLDSLSDDLIRDILPVPPGEWKQWFRSAVDPSGDDDFEGQRITDSLLFRCVLEPGEALAPVEIDRNILRKAPDAWRKTIALYPKPRVSYLQVSEWSSPIRIEIFSKDVNRFAEIGSLVLHCAALLPKYSFPVGLDIVDKFVRVPDWMSRPVNTHTAVRAMKTALDSGDDRLFNALRRMLCGSSRDFLLRPGVYR